MDSSFFLIFVVVLSWYAKICFCIHSGLRVCVGKVCKATGNCLDVCRG